MFLTASISISARSRSEKISAGGTSRKAETDEAIKATRYTIDTDQAVRDPLYKPQASIVESRIQPSMTM